MLIDTCEIIHFILVIHRKTPGERKFVTHDCEKMEGNV